MTVDLSLRHEPITELFPRATTTQQWKQYALTDDQVAQFEAYGYVGGVKLLDRWQVDALCGELEELTSGRHDGRELWYEYHSNESSDPGTILFHALGAWRIRPALHDILWHPGVLAPAAQLLGGGVRFWHDQLFCKPAHDGGVVAWHQDYSYWTRTVPMAHLTCWIGLDDATVENGCVHYIPGSHRWDLLPTTDLAGGMTAIQSILNDEQLAQFKPTPCQLKAGEAVFHHPLILHGSYENRSDRPRRAVVVNLFRDGTISNQDEPMLEGTESIPKGKPMSGQFYPLLYSPQG